MNAKRKLKRSIKKYDKKGPKPQQNMSQADSPKVGRIYSALLYYWYPKHFIPRIRNIQYETVKIPPEPIMAIALLQAKLDRNYLAEAEVRYEGKIIATLKDLPAEVKQDVKTSENPETQILEKGEQNV
jgi:hypothetical protein